jgi:hypothetical protein
LIRVRICTSRTLPEPSLPYYIYRISSFPVHHLDKAAACASFREASALVKGLRAAPDLPPGCKVKMIFAEHELQAEDLLSQVRAGETGRIGDD